MIIPEPRLHANSKPIEYKIEGECWICTSYKLNGAGYPCVRRSEIYPGKMTVAKYLYFLYKGSLLRRDLVCHTCNNKLCINPDHLYAGSYSSNSLDIIKAGGRLGPPSISEERKKKVRKLLKLKEGYATIARETGVSKRSIHRIKYGQI